jgi:hypothetical protein
MLFFRLSVVTRWVSHAIMSHILIIGELHLDLILELDVTLGHLAVHLVQFLKEPVIGVSALKL